MIFVRMPYASSYEVMAVSSTCCVHIYRVYMWNPTKRERLYTPKTVLFPILSMASLTESSHPRDELITIIIMDPCPLLKKVTQNDGVQDSKIFGSYRRTGVL
ncbi:uncharacterized protein LOC125500676 [Athalia rosae]|uniref:uncharacterized protein LOC125500676 n=1 Tax=Athalia rosae TaxID=37344 RepID=UPI002033B3F3|nr:uncharacterized protein LOC125500676 [Athalia rosae]